MSAALTRTNHCERVEVRTARKLHRCWSFAEECYPPGYPYDGKPGCHGTVRPGERYVISTIYPGHDSGYAEDGPETSAFCWPCANRWTNVRGALVDMGLAS